MVCSASQAQAKSKSNVIVRSKAAGSISVRAKRVGKKAEWTSSDTAVATVKAGKDARRAKITIRGQGACTVTASDGAKSYSFRVYAGPKLARLKNYKYLYVGSSRASRRSGMAHAIRDKKTFFYGKGGATIGWFFEKNDGYSPLDLIDLFFYYHPKGTLITDTGGNDIDNIEQYIDLYLTLMRRYPKGKFYYIALVPWRMPEYREESEHRREVFNRRLAEAFPRQTIDLYDYMLETGYETRSEEDYKHYCDDTIRKEYVEIMRRIGRKITVSSRGVVKDVRK